jgi:hypothetical protein
VRRAASGGRGEGSARVVLGLALGAIVAAHPRDASAQPTPAKRPVFVESSTCDATPISAVTSALRVELMGRLLDGPTRNDADRTTIDCSGDLVVVSVTAPGGASTSFQANLARAPANVRARILALAVAELVRDLDRETTQPQSLPRASPAPSPAQAPDRDNDVPAGARGPSHSVELGAFAQTSSFKSSGVWLAGGGLRLDYGYHRLSIGLDAALLATTYRFDLGSAQVLVGYGSPYAAWHERWGRAETRLGAGYALGAANLSGHATEAGAFGGTTTGPWSAPYAFLALGLTISDRVSVDARGEIGWVTSPVVGEVAGGAGVSIEGVWASVQLGLAIAL